MKKIVMMMVVISLLFSCSNENKVKNTRPKNNTSILMQASYYGLQ